MFKPCNRYLLIERNMKSEEESLIALPEGAFNTESRYEKVTISGVAPDVRPPIAVGQDVVVLTHMIEEVEFDNVTVYLVLENHVLGIVGDEYGSE